MENFDELRVSVVNLVEQVQILVLVEETVNADLLDLDLRLQAIERMLWRLDPSLAAACHVDQLSAPLTAESPRPSGAPSDPGTRSGSPSDSC